MDKTSPSKLISCENRMLARPMLAPASTTVIGRFLGNQGPSVEIKWKCGSQKNCRRAEILGRGPWNVPGPVESSRRAGTVLSHP